MLHMDKNPGAKVAILAATAAVFGGIWGAARAQELPGSTAVSSTLTAAQSRQTSGTAQAAPKTSAQTSPAIRVRSTTQTRTRAS